MKNDIDNDRDKIPKVTASSVATGSTGNIFSSSSSASASAAGGVVITGAKIRVAAVKKETKVERIDTIHSRNNKNKNKNKNKHNNHELKIKKEEDTIIKTKDKNNNDHNNDDSSTGLVVERNRNNASDTVDEYDYKYAHWKKGNWCWLSPLPATSTAKNNTGHNIEATNNSGNDDDVNNNMKNSSTVSILNGNREKNDNDKNNNEPPKKKLKHSNNNSDSKIGIIKHEKLSDNDNRRNNNNNNDSDVGYESWTEGNWCWIITSSSASICGVDFSTSKQKKRRSHNNVREKQQLNLFHSKDDDNEDDDDDNADDNEHDQDNYYGMERRKNFKVNNYRNNDNEDEDEAKIVGEQEDDYDGGDDGDDGDDDDGDDDDNDDDDYDDDNSNNGDDCNGIEGNIQYRTIANNKHNEDGNEVEDEVEVGSEVIVEYGDDSTDNNDDVGYESWSEGNWCWLLPHSIPATATGTGTATTITKNKSNRTLRVRCCHTHTTKTPQKGVFNKRWNQMFQRLVTYKEKYQTTNVPQSGKEDQQLSQWVSTQRQNYRKEVLSIYRMDCLNSIGFVWRLHAQWMEMYQKLIVYKKQHNTTSVPQYYKEDTQLGCWVYNQRTAYKNKTISVEQINHLESVGFVWKIVDRVPWIEMYERLVTYKQCYQSTLVPLRFTENPRLGRWVSKQREKYNNNILSNVRMELLNSIDFVWSVRN